MTRSVIKSDDNYDLYEVRGMFYSDIAKILYFQLIL